ncbi:nuclear transport factor 2 family protein [Actinomycetospora endophytica]|uniref:Nuclear transport factor 2 family protein n=1 Tax=Actinomycetospora endophytica TaxID=2291215 RepID=A0ABS8P716_9PSEU|nr:nuclear transport factor 2 family protein [Actinomycetospora endophytica]MCD2194052.1 nuclear transport factor 2 family protein [Actinomycetospora endophytica]
MSAEVEDVVRRWEAAEASGDDAATAGLLADDFLAVGPVGFVLDGPAWRRRHRDGLRVESVTLAVGTTRVRGDTALVVGVQDQRASYGGHRADGRFRITLVLRRDDGRWRVLGLHLSGPIPEGVA